MSDATESGSVAANRVQVELAGKYLTFELDKEFYGIEILKVQEIIGIMKITSVPRTPEYVRGVINLRGKVIPVVDLRLKFSMESIEDTDRTCVIVVQIGDSDQAITMGIIVDEVSEVLKVASDQIEPPPSFGASVQTEFILGMGKVENRVVMLLDVNKVLSQEELSTVVQVGNKD